MEKKQRIERAEEAKKNNKSTLHKGQERTGTHNRVTTSYVCKTSTRDQSTKCKT